MNRLISISLIAFFLSACGGNVKTDLVCSGQDWDKLGYETAMSGKSVRTFDRYREGCGSNLEKQAMNAYLDGFTRGVVEYCTFDNGHAIGLSGKPMPDACPLEARENFAKGFRLGSLEARETRNFVERLQDDDDETNPSPTRDSDTPGARQ